MSEAPCPYFLARPSAPARAGIVVVMEGNGMGWQLLRVCERLAAEGYAVIAPDVFHRLHPEHGDWERAFSTLRNEDALADIRSCVAVLRESGIEKVGITGFCMDGMYALLAACGCRGLSASVAYYGLLSYQHGLLHADGGLDPARKPRQPIDAVADLACPLLCCFGEDDEFVPMSDIDALRRGLDRAAQPAEVVVYPDCGHAFMNDTRPEAYRPETAKLAWERMLAFFRSHLG